MQLIVRTLNIKFVNVLTAHLRSVLQTEKITSILACGTLFMLANNISYKLLY